MNHFIKIIMKKYLAYDGINCEYEEFETIEEAQKWLEECFFDSDEGYHPDIDSCKIFELKQTVSYDVVDRKGEESEGWRYSPSFDEIWKHKFITVS